MKKKGLGFLAILLVSSSLFASLERPITEIECSIHPIDRDQIHPQGESATSQSFSSNWSGYAAASNFNRSTPPNGTVSYVQGLWVVPTLGATTDGTYCAIWVGIDGYQNGTVEQIGTSHNWLNGAQQNYAWFEMYPEASYEIGGFPVNNGDEISARIAYTGNNTFKLVLVNHTQNVQTTIPASYTTSASALRSSAEWIVEAPYSGEILPLADFKTVTFNYCSAEIDGIKGLINDANWLNDEITMESSAGVEAQTSALLKGGSCFQVFWKQE